MKTFSICLILAASAAAASAQIVPVRVSVPINPVMSLPKSMPSPLTGPLAGQGISLPTPIPALVPTGVIAAPAPSALPAAAPAIAPAAAITETIPAVKVDGSRENVAHPLRRIQPGVTVRFGAASGDKAEPAPAPQAEKENLDHLFDGDELQGNAVDGRRPVSHERRISLPEWDLERELGL